jgi:OOP family OmpA-OmpF porin
MRGDTVHASIRFVQQHQGKSKMNRMKVSYALAVLAATLGVAHPAAAQDASTPFYIGATAGQAKFKDACTGVPDCDDKDTALKIFGGYQFNRHLAAEIGYHALGEASMTGGTLEGKAWEAVGVASWPFNDRVSVFGKLGAYSGKLEARGTDESKTDATYGVGLRYDFTPHIGVRGEWQRYSKMGGDNGIPETDVDVLSVGLVYRF